MPQQRRERRGGTENNRQRQQHPRQQLQVPQPIKQQRPKLLISNNSAKQQHQYVPPIFSNRSQPAPPAPRGKAQQPRALPKLSYAQVASTKKAKPSRIFDNILPRSEHTRQNWVEYGQPLPDTFLTDSLSRQRQWQNGRTNNATVRWLLRTRQDRWRRMATGGTQAALLDSPECLTIPGVIYALVFPKTRQLYIGQTVNSAWHRWRQHNQARWKDTLEGSLQRSLQKTHIAADAFVIPLEVILMSGFQKEGHHSSEFIAEFRRRALVREQQWIRWCKSSPSRILNVVRDAALPDSRKRRERRSKLTEHIPKETGANKKQRAQSSVPKGPAKTKFVRIEGGRLLLDSDSPGEHKQIRRKLASLLDAQANGDDSLERVTKWGSATRKKITAFLIDQLDERESEHNASRILFHFLANAENQSRRSSPNDRKANEDPLRSTIERSRTKKEEKETLWLKVPWSRPEFTECKLQQFLQTREMVQAHPVPHVVKQTKISYSLNKPLGIILCNFTKVVKEKFPSTLPPPTECPCQAFRTAHALDYMGHVISTDPGAFKDASLRQMWQCGRKYRLPNNPAVMLSDLRKGLAEYAERVSAIYKMDPAPFSNWVARVMAHVESKVAAIPDSHWVTQGGLSSTGWKELRTIQEHMVIAPTDKSAHDFMFACKSAYLFGLHQELQSATYAPAEKTDAVIWGEHAKISQELGRIPIEAHSYLYGAGKLHKQIAGMRWIAGCSRQKVSVRRNKEYFHAATSISPVASALGAALRFCMKQLEEKDVKVWRPQGIRRYWIVTSVDQVAKHIKVHQRLLAQEQVWTDDFTTMYTKLPGRRLYEGVSRAINEAIQYYASTCKKAPEDIKFRFDWSNQGDAQIVFDHESAFTFEDVLKWMAAVIDGTYIKQGPDAPTLKQVIGVPMGGKASSELANLYCYSVESAAIDNLVNGGQSDLARSLAHTFRYIDDTLGFGQPQWQLFDYQMEHKKTSDDPHSVVFLGMRITTAGDFVQLRMEPKGAGWRWKPQRYIEWSSIHTKDTKRMLFKGLLVRAGTITNSMVAFQEAVQYYAEGLHARGFQRRALMDSFESYMRDHWQAFPYKVIDVRKWFKAELNKMYSVSGTLRGAVNVAASTFKPHAIQRGTHGVRGTLLCGLRAINYVLESIKRPEVDRTLLDDIAEHIVQQESLVSVDTDGLLTAPHPEGNYHVDVMTLALKLLTDLHVSVWRPTDLQPALAYVLGDGHHYQAVVKENSRWVLKDRDTQRVRNLPSLLRERCRIGMVLACSDQDVEMECRPSRKRQHSVESVDTAPVTTADGPAGEVEQAAEGTPEVQEKKARTDANDEQPTPLLLAHMQGMYVPLLLDQPVQVKEEDGAIPEWVQRRIAEGTLVHDEAKGVYRCVFCGHERPTALGVAVHMARYCKARPKTDAEPAINVDEENGDEQEDVDDAAGRESQQ